MSKRLKVCGDQLPADCVRTISDFSNAATLCAIRLVCKDFNDAVSSSMDSKIETYFKGRWLGMEVRNGLVVKIQSGIYESHYTNINLRWMYFDNELSRSFWKLFFRLNRERRSGYDDYVASAAGDLASFCPSIMTELMETNDDEGVARGAINARSIAHTEIVEKFLRDGRYGKVLSVWSATKSMRTLYNIHQTAETNEMFMKELRKWEYSHRMLTHAIMEGCGKFVAFLARNGCPKLSRLGITNMVSGFDPINNALVVDAVDYGLLDVEDMLVVLSETLESYQRRRLFTIVHHLVLDRRIKNVKDKTLSIMKQITRRVDMDETRLQMVNCFDYSIADQKDIDELARLLFEECCDVSINDTRLREAVNKYI